MKKLITLTALAVAMTASPTIAGVDEYPGQTDDESRTARALAGSTLEPTGRLALGRIMELDDSYGQVVALCAIGADGSDLVQRTEGESAYPALSSSGSWIAFGGAMCLANADGIGILTLVEPAADEIQLSADVAER